MRGDPSDADALARRILGLRRLVGRVDPETLAITIEELSEYATEPRPRPGNGSITRARQQTTDFACQSSCATRIFGAVEGLSTPRTESLAQTGRFQSGIQGLSEGSLADDAPVEGDCASSAIDHSAT
jgi:hypothetical protein